MMSDVLEQLIEKFKIELGNEIAHLIITSIKSEMKNSFEYSSVDMQFLTTEDVMKLLQVSKSTVINLRAQAMPFIKIGDSIRFDREEVLEFVKKKGAIN